MGKVTEKIRWAKPFVKWAGGKTQLLGTFQRFYPAALHRGEIERYIEPFAGSGAVLLYLMQQHSVREAFIADVNPALTAAYTVVRENVEQLIDFLAAIEKEYLPLNEKQRRIFYYTQRDKYNRMVVEGEDSGARGLNRDRWNVNRAGLFQFLNRTCYNGLYRVNRAGLFNVPPGSYKKPRICNAKNLRAVSQVLQRTTILQGDYRDCARYINKKSFVYFDPPYRPLSPTASFTSYSSASFNDRDQAKLAAFYRAMDQKGALLMLSNSNPGNTDTGDSFFDQLYRGYYIHTVHARRLINSKRDRRGTISELIITNYIPD